jgi:hypothetical protein
MKRPDCFCDVRRDVGPKRFHAVRRFFGGVIGSPKTSSKDRPFFPLR